MKKKYTAEEKIQRDKESKQKWYNANKKEVDASANEKRKQWREVNRSYISDYKKGKSCSCGESHPSCLDFHHKDSTLKERAISHMSKSPVSLNRLIKEIEKCELICSNCHRKLHWSENHENRDIY